MTTAVFAGCRDLHVGHEWWPALDRVREEHGITAVRHGACTLPGVYDLCGGDKVVDMWARARGLVVEMFPAPWELTKRLTGNAGPAGPRRIRDMFRGDRGYDTIDRKIVTTETIPGSVGLAVCLPGGGGTRGTAREAQRLGIPVVEIPFQHRAGLPRVINAHHHLVPEAGEVVRRHASIPVELGKPPAEIFESTDRRPPLPDPFLYIGRSPPLGPSPLANPFTVKRYGREAMPRYRRWLWSRIKDRDEAVLGALRAITSEHHLVCHCKRLNGSGLCHGDVVVDAWEWMRDSTPSSR